MSASTLTTCLVLLLIASGVQAQNRTVVRMEAKAGDRLVAAVVVDTHDTADLAEWGSKAGREVLTWLPKLSTLLTSEGHTPPNEVTLRFDPSYDGVAYTQGATIVVAADWVRRHPDDVGLVIHELVHVVQDYRGRGEGWLTEGIADYIRYWIYEPGRRTFPIERGKSHYRQGYGTDGAFLDWIERTRSKGAVAKLNGACREGRYDAARFAEIAGTPLDELWEAFVTASEMR